MPELEPTPEYFVETFSFVKDLRQNSKLKDILKPGASGISYIVDLDSRKIHISDLPHGQFRKTVQAYYSIDGTVWVPKNNNGKNPSELSIFTYDQAQLIKLFNESLPNYKNDTTKVVKLLETKILKYLSESLNKSS